MSSGFSKPATAEPPMTLLARSADFLELTKPRIVVLELVAVLITLHIATDYGAPGSPWGLALLLAVVVGTGLVAGSANGVNMWLERELDARMLRTQNRPLPSKRLAPNEALVFGVLTLAMGVSMLAMFAGPLPAGVAIATWAIYVVLYTPLKTRSWTNTAVGALSGAAPLAIGWTAGGGGLADPMLAALVGVMYLWQFPHFMAIAWLCRDDYARVDYQMSTTLDPTGWWAGLQAVVGSALLLAVSLAPLALSEQIGPLLYAGPVLLVGGLLLHASSQFLRQPCDAAARRLMRMSLIYIPVWLLALWLAGA